jgi:hypothetical protein
MKGNNYFVKTNNNKRIYNSANDTEYVKDGINNHVVSGAYCKSREIRTKAAVWHQFNLKAGEEKSIKFA